jgi:hypothetical protein
VLRSLSYSFFSKKQEEIIMGLNQVSAGKNQTSVNGPPPHTIPAIAFHQKILDKKTYPPFFLDLPRFLGVDFIRHTPFNVIGRFGVSINLESGEIIKIAFYVDSMLGTKGHFG